VTKKATKATATKATKSTKKALKKPLKLKKAAKPEKPTSGQSGPKLDLVRDDLNPKETAVLTLLRRKGEASIADLMKAFPNKPKAKANSWVRNSLRRLVCARLAKKVGRGTYKKAA